MDFGPEKERYRLWQNTWSLLLRQSFSEEGILKTDTNRQLEEQLSGHSQSAYVHLCANPRDALSILLAAWEVDENDAVFLPCLGSADLLRPILQSGAEVVFCDIHPRTFTMDVISLQKEIRNVMSLAQKRARVVITFDAFGLPADYPALEKICERYGLYLIDFATHGLGGSLRRQGVPSFGSAGICSFSPGNTVAAFSDGAAIYLDNEALSTNVRRWLGNGYDPQTGRWEVPGLNSHLHPFESAALLRKFAAFNETEAIRRAELAAFYSAQLQDRIDPPFVPAGFTSGWQAYCVLVPHAADLKALQANLADDGIETKVPDWTFLPDIYRDWTGTASDTEFTQVKQVHERMLLLPFHPFMTLKEAKEVCYTLLKYWPDTER